MSATSPRIAILGFSIEVNRFSPISTAADFAKRADISGDEIVANGRELPCITSPDLPGFFKEMDRTGDWTPVPMRLIQAQPGGPVDQAFFDGFLSEIDAMLLAAGELDGVYVVAHGAGACTESHDPDGDLLATIRARVGPQVPVIGVFDLHANVSPAMVNNLDVFVGYLENPHTDIRARGVEAAQHMRRLLAGEKTAVAMVKLPLTPPSITLLTAEVRTPTSSAMGNPSWAATSSMCRLWLALSSATAPRMGLRPWLPPAMPITKRPRRWLSILPAVPGRNGSATERP